MPKAALEIGPLTVEPGNRGQGYVPFGRRMDGSVLGIPVIAVHGAEDGPCLLVDGAIHGDEVTSSFAIQEVARSLDPAKLAGTLLAVPAVNPPAVEAMQRATPRGMVGDALPNDLNRAFPGSPDGTTSQRIAHAYLTEVIAKADYYVNCHSGGHGYMGPPKVLYEQDEDPDDPKTEQLARAWGWPVLWCNSGGYGFNGSSTGAAHLRGIVSITPEHGGGDQSPLRRGGYENNFASGIRNVLRHLRMIGGEPDIPSRWLLCKDDSHVFVHHDGILLFEPWIDLKVEVKKGDYLGRVVDLFGETLEEVIAPWDGVVLLIRTYPYVRTGDWSISISLHGEYGED